MTKKFDAKLSLNLSQEMYSSLLLETGGISKEIPNLIRQKLEASYLSKNDAKRLLAQQEVANKMLTEIMRGLVIPTALAAVQINESETKKKQTLTSMVEELKGKQIDKINRFNQEAGL